MIITIDGPVGTGKSTIAKLLAEKLGFIHFDTGAMYRAVTYAAIKYQVSPEDSEELLSLLEDFKLDIQKIDGAYHYFYEGEDISNKIRLGSVTQLVSKVSAIGPVRKKLVELQHRLSEEKEAVFEGRDMGTVVFPNAELKIYLIASSEIRAKRRYDELKEKFPEETADLTFKDVLRSITDRDTFDSQRELSPLKKADDAHVIDTSDLSIEEVLNAIIHIKNAIN